MSERLDEYFGEWSPRRVTGALLGYVTGPKAMGFLSIPGAARLEPIHRCPDDGWLKHSEVDRIGFGLK